MAQAFKHYGSNKPRMLMGITRWVCPRQVFLGTLIIAVDGCWGWR